MPGGSRAASRDLAACALAAGKTIAEAAAAANVKVEKARLDIAIAAKQINPLTGDFVNFSNSRFYLAIYPKGAWRSENTIAIVSGNGTLGFSGLGVSGGMGTAQSADNVTATVASQINFNNDVVKAFIAGLATVESVQKAAKVAGVTAEQFVQNEMERAAKLDIGIIGFGIAVL
jgi:hypothetical protein